MAEAQDFDALKRRGRRRLIGAVALVLLAVIVLPMVFDPEPRHPAPAVSVRIPSEEETGFAPKVTPKAPPATPGPKALEPPKPQAAAPQAAPAPEPKAQAAPAPEPKPQAAPAPKPPQPAADKPQDRERARAEAALADAEYVVQVAALANAAKVKEVGDRLAAAKLTYYTEQVPTKSGTVTRVRVGPFKTREAAEKALARVKGLGEKQAKVMTR